MSANTYRRRKAEGLCVRCGGKIEDDRKGKVMCQACTNKSTIEKLEISNWRRSYGVCPRCGKTKLVGNERNCLDCRVKNDIARRKQRELYRDRELRYQHKSQKNKVIKYHQRKEQGLCVTCGEELKKDELGYSNCLKCRIKKRNKHIPSCKPKEEYQSHIWKSQGLCPLCGEQLYEKHRLCKKHYDIDKLNGGKTRKWINDNQAIFQGTKK